MRRRVEEMLVEGQRDGQVISMLENLVGEAAEGSETALFAHRQLAELRLEDSPWQAALHLRRLLTADVADDGVHALLGLCHALMGNFRTAVGSYRRALQQSPNNPWYHHNLGHLLDVGLSRPRVALAHLRKAHELEPDEDEVSASLAHCLARLGELPEAERLIRLALQRAPRHREHQDLLRWIQDGAPDNKTSASGPAVAGSRNPVAGGGSRRNREGRSREGRSREGRSREGRSRDARASEARASEAQRQYRRDVADSGDTRVGVNADEVTVLLAASMPLGHCSDAELARAKVLWRDYQRACRPRVVKPAVFAAAVEYAVARLSGRGVTQAAVALRYGVGSRSLSNRYAEIRDGLGLEPNDPRY